MPKGISGDTARQLSALMSTGAVGGQTDAELLARFATRDGQSAETAFATLVERHGPIVLRTCRARLHDEHAAQDAFQATFLVLACRANSLRVQDTLGPWLHSVAWRVASCARAAEIRRLRHEQKAARLAKQTDLVRDTPDWEPLLHEEINQLAERFRQPVILCGLLGLSTAQAARHLGWPVGTVRSRLARARDQLRERLTRRGLASFAGASLTAAIANNANASVPIALALATAQAGMFDVAKMTATGLVPTSAVNLAKSTLWSMTMIRVRVAAAVMILALTTLTTAVVLARPVLKSSPPTQDPPKRQAIGHTTVITSDAPGNSLAEQLAAIKAEYEAKNRELWAAQEKAASPKEQNELYRTMSPDDVAYCKAMIELSSLAPKDPAARDALLWVIDFPGRADEGAYGEEFARAAERLVRDHGDDPEAIRIALQLDNVFTLHRDQLLASFYASAKGHESKGLARLALGRYLQRKSEFARASRKSQGRQTYIHKGVIGDDGKPYDAKEEQNDQSYAYVLLLKQCDPDYIRDEAERLLNEVAKDYSDVPCITPKIRKLEALLKQPKPEWNGKPLTEDELQKLKKMVTAPPSLAKVAEGHLDQMHNFTIGMPAPEIEGVDFDGKPLKLSDFRGKVVVIAFWGTWCGPCMAEVPNERGLVEKYKGRPFAMLGVDCNEPKATAAKVMKEERITWPNWHDGEDTRGPIVTKYHVASYPTVFVIDAEGKIQSNQSRGKGLEDLVDKLVKETEAKTTAK